MLRHSIHLTPNAQQQLRLIAQNLFRNPDVPAARGLNEQVIVNVDTNLSVSGDALLNAPFDMQVRWDTNQERHGGVRQGGQQWQTIWVRISLSKVASVYNIDNVQLIPR